jgi:hypothetical protein
MKLTLLITLATLLLAGSAASQVNQATLPTEAGVYAVTPNGYTKILGQIVTFQRTGSLLASALTGGIVSQKGNVQLLGPHAQTATGLKPVFYFIPAKQEAEAGGSAGDLVLIRLAVTPQSDRRQFEVGAQGTGRASAGISITHQIQLLRSEEGSGVYKLTPAAALRAGEYALYLARGEGMAAYVYDFSVPDDSETVTLALSEKSTVPETDVLKNAQQICPNVRIMESGSKSNYGLEVAKLEHSNDGRFSFKLLDPNGLLVRETRANSLDEGLDSICHAIELPSPTRRHAIAESDEPGAKGNDGGATAAAPNTPETSPTNVSALATISVSSNPDGADIYVDGAFVGSAPAALKLSARKHTIKIALPGYRDWSRDITTLLGSQARLTANLEKDPQ